jgi:hypothetical protein
MSEIGWNFRLADERDAEDFVAWTLSNPLIDPKDIESAKKKNNPTAMYFAVENPEGKVVGFVPTYVQLLLAHLVFNPDSTSAERKQAMAEGMAGLVRYASRLGINEIVTMSRESYPVAQWALRNGFETDPRQLLKFELNKEK